MPQGKRIPFWGPWTGEGSFPEPLMTEHFDFLFIGEGEVKSARGSLLPKISLRQAPGKAEGFLEEPQIEGFLGMKNPVGPGDGFQWL